MKNEVSNFLSSRIEQGDFPSAVYLVAEKGVPVLEDALGRAVAGPERIDASMETIYDLASLTKVLVTGLLIAKFIEDDQIDLSDQIAQYFPEFEIGEKDGITIKQLLTHTSGFAAWKPFYLTKNDHSNRKNVLSQIASDPLLNPIGERVVYSDFSFLLLGFLAEKISGLPLDDLARKEIFEPLDLKETFFNPPPIIRSRIAASEKGNNYEKQTCIELGYLKQPISEEASGKFRADLIWGEVHDNNCYFLYGVAGHAGLFSSAPEVLMIAKQFLAESTSILKPETCKFFRTNFTPGLNQARSLGFQLAETDDSTAGEALSKDSFGHLGFTGTSLWIDPMNERIYILLTNRTHDRNLPFADLKSTRQNFHRFASDFMDSLRDN
ncbi:MAG: beta-lactamase family protein [Pyrinomonadaceae bacterium]|nr:beta-lactamase family protein [Pyrinomonadaceae bacterium]